MRRNEPEVIYICGGWGAVGDGWVAYASNREAAIRQFKALLSLKSRPAVFQMQRRRTSSLRQKAA